MIWFVWSCQCTIGCSSQIISRCCRRWEGWGGLLLVWRRFSLRCRRASFCLLVWRIHCCLLRALRRLSLFGLYIYSFRILLAFLIALVIKEIRPSFCPYTWAFLTYSKHLRRTASLDLWRAYREEVHQGNRITPNCRFPYFLASESHCRYCFFGFMEWLITKATFSSSIKYINGSIYQLPLYPLFLLFGLLRLCWWGLQSNYRGLFLGCRQFAWQIRSRWHRWCCR